MYKKLLQVFALLIICCCCVAFVKKDKPTLYLIGDSTVATGSPTNPIQGWGGLMVQFFDTTRINIENRAVSGTSTRTYQNNGVHDKKMLANGMWDGVLKTLKKGDYVMMQFGHNDETPVTDTTRHRGTLKGIGDDTVTVFNKFLNRNETVHTYGWYLSKFVTEIQKRGATAIICSPVPMNRWKDDKIIRRDNDYAKWAEEVAQKYNASFIALNKIAADKYDAFGKAEVTANYFVVDNVHTNAKGALLHVEVVVNEVKKLKKCDLKKYIKP